MFDFTRHEGIRILLEDAQTGPSAEKDSLAAIGAAGIIFRILEFASAGRFIFWCLGFYLLGQF
jgi:hypothetical protein